MSNQTQDIFVSDADLARVECHMESTPDGSLSTFKWIGHQAIIAVCDELAEEIETFDLILPWELECIGRNVERGCVYYKRITQDE